MKNALACLASLVAFVSFAADKPATEGAEPGQWTMDFDAARKVAAEKKLPILINFTGSDWCAWCKHMDKEVFSQEAWKTYAKDNLILVWIDFPQDKTLVPEKYVKRNAELSKFFEIEGYPAYIVLDADGKNQIGQLGADQEINPTLFISHLKSILKKRPSEIEKMIKGLPEKTAQEYAESQKKLEAARAEQKALNESYEKKSAELHTQIDALEKRLETIRTAATLATLPKEKADAYSAKKASFDKINDEFQAWIATRPERNDANTAKYDTWRKELSKLEVEMQALLD